MTRAREATKLQGGLAEELRRRYYCRGDCRSQSEQEENRERSTEGDGGRGERQTKGEGTEMVYKSVLSLSVGELGSGGGGWWVWPGGEVRRDRYLEMSPYEFENAGRTRQTIILLRLFCVCVLLECVNGKGRV